MSASKIIDWFYETRIVRFFRREFGNEKRREQNIKSLKNITSFALIIFGINLLHSTIKAESQEDPMTFGEDVDRMIPYFKQMIFNGLSTIMAPQLQAIEEAAIRQEQAHGGFI